MATPPKRHLEKQFARISRQSHAFQPIFIPDRKGKLKGALGYIIASALQKNDMILAALMVVPRGYVAIAFDKKARRSKFMQVVNHRVSREIRKTQKHEESIWTNGKPGDIPILDPGALKKVIVETLTLPIRLGYVRKLSDWPGFYIGPEHWGEHLLFNKSKAKSSRKSEREREEDEDAKNLVDFATLNPGLPESLFSKEEIAALKAEIQQEIAKTEAKYKRKNQPVIGPKKCFFKKYFKRKKPAFRFELQYKKAAFLATHKKRIKAAKQVLKRFRTEYERIRGLFLDNQPIRDTPVMYPRPEDDSPKFFPAGTVKMYLQWKFGKRREKEDDAHHFLKTWIPEPEIV